MEDEKLTIPRRNNNNHLLPKLLMLAIWQDPRILVSRLSFFVRCKICKSYLVWFKIFVYYFKKSKFSTANLLFLLQKISIAANIIFVGWLVLSIVAICNLFVVVVSQMQLNVWVVLVAIVVDTNCCHRRNNKWFLLQLITTFIVLLITFWLSFLSSCGTIILIFLS